MFHCFVRSLYTDYKLTETILAHLSAITSGQSKSSILHMQLYCWCYLIVYELISLLPYPLFPIPYWSHHTVSCQTVPRLVLFRLQSPVYISPPAPVKQGFEAGGFVMAINKYDTVWNKCSSESSSQVSLVICCRFFFFFGYQILAVFYKLHLNITISKSICSYMTAYNHHLTTGF